MIHKTDNAVSVIQTSNRNKMLKILEQIFITLKMQCWNICQYLSKFYDLQTFIVAKAPAKRLEKPFASSSRLYQLHSIKKSIIVLTPQFCS